MFSVPLKCGNCGNLVDFVFWHIVDHTERTPEEIKQLGEPQLNRHNMSAAVQFHDDNDQVTASAHTYCPRCHHPALILYECRRRAHDSIKKIIEAGEGNLMGGSGAVSVSKYYPLPRKAEQSPHWPESLRRVFIDTQDMLAEGKSPSIILATARSVLELALKELDNDPKPSLYQRIEHLHQKGIITSAVKDWAHAIRLDGNAGTHNGAGSETDATEYIEFLKLFLDMTFSLPQRIEEKRQPK